MTDRILSRGKVGSGTVLLSPSLWDLPSFVRISSSKFKYNSRLKAPSVGTLIKQKMGCSDNRFCFEVLANHFHLDVYGP